MPADGASADVKNIITDFNATLAKWYPGFDPTVLGLPVPLPAMPSLASVTRAFDSETALNDYVTSTQYSTVGYPEVRPTARSVCGEL